MSSNTTHLFTTAAPAPGHMRPLVVLACKILITHRRLRPDHTLVITMPVTGSDIKAMADKEMERCLHSENESLRENLHIISLGGSGILVPLLGHLMKNFAPFYMCLHKCEPITCQETGKVYTVSTPPSVVMADFFTYDTLALIAQLNEQDQKKVPVLTWNCGALAPIMRLMGPEQLGGVGDVEAQAIELAKTAGMTIDEAEALCFQPQKGKVIKVPGLPAMYDYEFFAKSEVLPPELLKVQLTLHKQGHKMFHDLEGTISSSCTAFEPEACKASKEWYGQRNRSCYIVGPCVPDDLFDDAKDSRRIADFDPSSARDMEIMTFLDKVYETSGERSVLYIAFGTLFSPSNARLWKFVEVVLDLKIPFVLAYGLEKMGDISEMPEHIATRINASPERALSRKWIPQQAVLAHRATGWFLTHCGNNGVFEAISQAVPMIAWALDGEQPGTAAYITLTLDIAYQLIEVRDGLGLRPMYRGCQPKGTMEALQEEARIVLQDAFHGEGGMRKRKNIEKLRENVRAGLKENGDSAKDLMKFVEEYL